MNPERVIIMGAAGRDFHNFNVFFRGNPAYRVVAFTATQIPDITGRRYPPELAGDGYPEGIPIHDEAELEELIRRHRAGTVVFAYSDVGYGHVMHQSSRANASGADFWLMGAEKTMLESSRPVVAVCAVRTGSGKSQTTRRVAQVLRQAGKRVVAVRHPMPYGDLNAQRVQRFASTEDLARHHCTIEEMEEYEPHIDAGVVVYAGVDYEAILREAEKEADIILWDGGNNDLSFYRPALQIVVVDPHRPGHELAYYPGEANLRRADVVVVNKVDSASPEGIATVRENARRLAPNAVLVEAESPLTLDHPELIQGKRVLVVEDGPTLTHGEMTYGAGVVAARRHGAAELVDPRPWTVASIQATYAKYPGIGALLPAMGYGDQQVKDLETTINRVDCDVVVIGTPIDLRRLIRIDKPTVRVRYDLKERTRPDLAQILRDRGLA